MDKQAADFREKLLALIDDGIRSGQSPRGAAATVAGTITEPQHAVLFVAAFAADALHNAWSQGEHIRRMDVRQAPEQDWQEDRRRGGGGRRRQSPELLKPGSVYGLVFRTKDAMKAIGEMVRSDLAWISDERYRLARAIDRQGDVWARLVAMLPSDDSRTVKEAIPEDQLALALRGIKPDTAQAA